MLRKLLVALFMFSGIGAYAQGPGKTDPALPKPVMVPVDYKLMGAPMPKLLFIAYHDTSANKDTSYMHEHMSRKARKRKAQDLLNHQQLKTVSGDDLKNNANLFVMMFNPTCSHCEYMTSQVEKNINLFDRSKFVLLASPSMKEYVPSFATRYHIDDHPFMYIGTDSTDFTQQVFLYQSLPQINIYNADRKLIRTYTGEVSIDTLKKYIQ
jgi:hypothetical protein